MRRRLRLLVASTLAASAVLSSVGDVDHPGEYVAPGLP